ncbi:MAG: carboxypeptidase regulatory-like domain-containing protein [Capsulimonadaceae bacterium]|nr:carboxypeptidase regulatory-like domain-containing protein [Capsulimonadaceae bacterium]
MSFVGFDNVVKRVVWLICLMLAAMSVSGEAVWAKDYNRLKTPFVSDLNPVIADAAASRAIRATQAPIASDALATPGRTSNGLRNPYDPSSNTTFNSVVQSSDYTLATYGYSTALAAYTNASTLPTNLDPVWSPDESFIVFASNRTSATNATPSALFHLYAIDAQGDASSLTLITPSLYSTSSQRYPAFVGSNVSRLIFAQSPTATGDYFLYSATLSTSSGYVLSGVQQIPTPFGASANLTVQHPTASSTTIVFSGAASGVTTGRQLYSVSLSGSGAVTQLTYDNNTTPSDDLDPSFSPDGNFIAFDSTSTGWTHSNGEFTASGSGTIRQVYVMNLGGSRWSQLTDNTTTNYTANSNITPSWSRSTTNSLLNSDGYRLYIFFSSLRLATSGSSKYHIYYVRADESSDSQVNSADSTSYRAIVSTENQNNSDSNGNYSYGTNAATQVDSSDPLDTNKYFSQSVTSSSTILSATSVAPQDYNHFQPSVSTLVTYPMVVYSSDRFISNNNFDNPVNGLVRYNNTNNALDYFAGTPSNPAEVHIDNGPDNYPTGSIASTFLSPAGVDQVPAAGTTESSNLEISVSRLFDTNPPTLLRYDESTSEIFRIESANAQGSATKYALPGSKINIVARLSERQTGINSVWLQIKDPDSKYQDASHLEHKVFSRWYYGLEDAIGTNDERIIVGEDDEATLVGSMYWNSGAGEDISSNTSNAGTSLTVHPLGSYTARLCSLTDYTSGPKAYSDSLKSDAGKGSTKLTVVGTIFRPGDTIAIMPVGASGTGALMVSLVTTVSYSTAGNFVSIYDPTWEAFGAPGSTTAPVVTLYRIFSRTFDWTGNEIDCQALNINNPIIAKLSNASATGSGTSRPNFANLSLKQSFDSSGNPTEGPDLTEETDLETASASTTFDSTNIYNYVTPDYWPGESDAGLWSGRSNTPPSYWAPMYPLQASTSGIVPVGSAFKTSVGNTGVLYVNTITGFRTGDILQITDGTNADYVQVIGTSTYPEPYYTPQTSTAAGYGTIMIQFDGTVATNHTYDPSATTITLYEKQSVGGGVLYMSTLATPPTPSDFYLDLIAYNNAKYPVSIYNTGAGYQGAALDWRIYDNVSGFTTASFSPTNSILVVNDHMLPQKFFGGRFGSTTTSTSLLNVPSKIFGAESYFTDIETTFNDKLYTTQLYRSNSFPAGGFYDGNTNIDSTNFPNGFPITMRPPANLPDFGMTYTAGVNFAAVWPTVTPLVDSCNDTVGAIAAGEIVYLYRDIMADNVFSPPYANGLGVNSYVDKTNEGSVYGLNQMSAITSVARNGSTSSDTYSDNVYDDVVNSQPGSPVIDSQLYDLWRILSRGPVTSDVLSAYAPSVVTQPFPDPTAVGTVTGSVALASAPTSATTVTISMGGVSTSVSISSTSAQAFTLNNVPIEATSLSVVATGYATVTQSVVVTTGATTTLSTTITLAAGTSTAAPAYTAGNNVVVSNACVLWVSPFTGDEFVESGTLADMSVQTNLITFLQGGGRLLVEGEDVGNSLTTAGTASNTLYNSYLGATFKSDTTSGTSGAFALTPSTGKYHYISTDAFVNSAFGGQVHSGFDRSVENSGSWSTTYVAPSALPNVISNYWYNYHGIISASDGDAYADGSLNGFGADPSNVDYQDEFTVGSGTTVEIETATAGSAGGHVALVYTGDPLANFLGNGVTNPAGAKIAVYSSFGLEDLSQAMQRGPMASAAREPAFESNNVRTGILHNLVCVLRTGRISGTITSSGTGAQPIAGATVRATLSPAATNSSGVSTSGTYYTATTDSSGNYLISGLPPGQYAIGAVKKLGYLNTLSQASGTTYSVHGGDYRTYSASIYEPEVSVSFTITDGSTKAAVNGATVTLYLGTDTTESNPLYSAVTNVSGLATATGVVPGTYTVVVTTTQNYATYDSSALTTPQYYTVSPSAGYYIGSDKVLTQAQYNAITTSQWLTMPIPVALTASVPVWFQLEDSTNGDAAIPLTSGYSVTIGSNTFSPDGTTDGLTGSIKLAPNTYAFTAKATGYQTVSGNVTITSSGYSLNGTIETYPVAVVMTPTSSTSIGTVYGFISSATTWYNSDHGLLDSSGTSKLPKPTVTFTDASGNDYAASNLTWVSPEGTYASGTGTGTYNYMISNVPFTSSGTAYTLTVTSPAFRYTTAPSATVTVSSSNTYNADLALTPSYDTGFSGFSTATNPNYPSATSNPYGLQMLALPYDFTDSLLLRDRFGGAFTSTQIIDMWDASSQAWVSTSSGTARGHGFWVRFVNPFSTSTYETTTIPVLGTYTALSAEATPATIQLYAGWNLIGSPWAANVFGEHISVLDSNSNQVTWASATSDGVGLISPYIYTFDTGSWQYVTTVLDTAGSDVTPFKPFIGYWLYATSPCTLQIPNPGS